MKVAFLHPDLGLGGAERLVVDAAMGLVGTGHTVEMYTSHYSSERCFAETRSGAFPIHVYGDWLPRHVWGAFHIIFALARNAWLAVAAALFAGPVDVFVCDQVSICVPILRLLAPNAKVLFYCHYPDQLLSARGHWVKALYRAPFDWLEEVTTAAAHGICVNSNFTKGVVGATFPSLAPRLADIRVLWPCIDVDEEPAGSLPPAQVAPVVFLSINRYERKKDISLAVRALAQVAGGAGAPDVRLIIAGGYDPRVAENTEHYRELHHLASSLGLRTCPETAQETPDTAAVVAAVAGGGAGAPQVGFVRSFSDAEKAALLQRTAGVVYTPTKEHFGIVPIETMAAERPVIACASGGPLESIAHGETGFLQQPTADSFAGAMRQLAGSPDLVAAMGRAGKARVQAMFSRQAFAARLDGMCRHLAAHGSLAGLD